MIGSAPSAVHVYRPPFDLSDMCVVPLVSEVLCNRQPSGEE
jgi:hypothetical protein